MNETVRKHTMVETVVKVLGDFRTIGLGLLLVIAAVSWAGDLRYMQKTYYTEDQKMQAIQRLNDQIADLETRLLYDKGKKQMLQALIINKKNRIRNIKESQR